jgi:adenylosuccinate synthase
MPGKIVVVSGGQYGSEGKGLIAGHLSVTEKRPLMAVRVGGPNAGHTVWRDGVEFKLQSLPVAAAVRDNALLVSASGSEVEWEQLQKELRQTARYDTRNRYYLDDQATIIDPAYQGMHASSSRWGGTGKGVNRARASRMIRDAELAMSWAGLDGAPLLTDTAGMMREWLRTDGCVMIEGTQGYGLGTHAGEYPHCTGNDCTAIDFLSQAGLSPWMASEFEAWVVLRTHPIRVAGNSGPFHEGETSWEELRTTWGDHIPTEQTTVTKKTRRVGNWDPRLARAAVEANGGPVGAVHVALTFFDYVRPSIANCTSSEVWSEDPLLNDYADDIGQKIELVGTGVASVVDLRKS